MFEYTNNHDISLALAVFLMYDSYDHDPRPNSISATTIIRPLRQLALIQQEKQLTKQVDISDLVSSRMGTAIHDGCERAWKDPENLAKALKVLGASDEAIKRVKVNPTVIANDDIPVFIENRVERPLGNYIITGKYDLVLDGTLNDYKSTSVWSYIYDSNSDNYSKQGSIYRWLSPEHIDKDYMNINYVFTDWSAQKARQDPKYPQLRVLTKKYPIWQPSETEAWLQGRITQLEDLMGKPQSMLPECTDEELWASETVYKYYKNPANKNRATKNFSTMDEALIRKSQDGDVGVIDTVPGEVKACRYCSAVNVCEQAEKLLASGRLVL